MYNELHEIWRMNPGNEVLQVLDETPEVEIGKSRENNRRKICAPQFWVKCNSKASDIKILELGC